MATWVSVTKLSEAPWKGLISAWGETVCFRQAFVIARVTMTKRIFSNAPGGTVTEGDGYNADFCTLREIRVWCWREPSIMGGNLPINIRLGHPSGECLDDYGYQRDAMGREKASVATPIVLDTKSPNLPVIRKRA